MSISKSFYTVKEKIRYLNLARVFLHLVEEKRSLICDFPCVFIKTFIPCNTSYLFHYNIMDIEYEEMPIFERDSIYLEQEIKNEIKVEPD